MSKEAMLILKCLAVLGLIAAAPAEIVKPGKPLFEASDVLRLTIRGPVAQVASPRGSGNPQAASLIINGETLPITIAARGLTRRKAETCQFAPLRVSFTRPPGAGSLFAGQKRLKLVTHCRGGADFQQFILLEYAAYRMFNRLTPASYRARLAMIDYVGADGRPVASRYGFFIEDTDDVARRNGMREAKVGDRILVASLNSEHSGRVAMFQHMLGNHDWSMRAAPTGAGCCHNVKLIGPPAGSTLLIPVPYDFDYSGLVGTPYAVPPAQLPIADVRERLYRGYCRDNLQAASAAAEMRAARNDLLSILAATPGLEQRSRDRAATYLDRFFRDTASDELTARKVLKSCI